MPRSTCDFIRQPLSPPGQISISEGAFFASAANLYGARFAPRNILPRSKSESPDHLSAKVRDFMEVPPTIVRTDATIDQAAGTMWEKNIGSVIVVDETGHMAGILTERDVLFAVTKSLVGRQVPVSSIMSKTSLQASPNESIVTSVNRMIKGGVRHLPVIDKDGAPVGMVSMRDAMGISEPLLKFVFRRAAQTRAQKK